MVNRPSDTAISNGGPESTHSTKGLALRTVKIAGGDHAFTAGHGGQPDGRRFAVEKRKFGGTVAGCKNIRILGLHVVIDLNTHTRIGRQPAF